MARIAKAKIQKMAQDMDALYESLENTRDNPKRQDSFYEARGSYFTLWMVTKDLGIEQEVFNARKTVGEA